MQNALTGWGRRVLTGVEETTCGAMLRSYHSHWDEMVLVMWPFWVTHALYVNSLVSGCLGFNSTLTCGCVLPEVKRRNFTNSVRKTTSQNLEHTVLTISHAHCLLLENKGDCEGEGHLSPGAEQLLYEQLCPYLEVSFLRGGSLAVDPGAHRGQFLLLCRRELGLMLLHAAELCQVSPQHLFSSPKHSKGL